MKSHGLLYQPKGKRSNKWLFIPKRQLGLGELLQKQIVFPRFAAAQSGKGGVSLEAVAVGPESTRIIKDIFS